MNAKEVLQRLEQAEARHDELILQIQEADDHELEVLFEAEELILLTIDYNQRCLDSLFPDKPTQ